VSRRTGEVPGDGRRSVEVRTEPAYVVRIGAGVLDEVTRALAPYSRHVVLTDETVEALHGSALGLAGAPRLALPPGEETKSFAQLERALDFLASSGLDRRSCVVAFGGGVVGDLAGLAASLYMRGIALVQCPTTLLSQVDSSVGGKTAVNLRAGKNLAGTFCQPRAVFADTAVLATLPEAELASGLGEVVKTA
jgi:3-dehydroquinate synthase